MSNFTIAVIKPEAVDGKFVGNIIDIIENSRLEIVKMKMTHMTPDTARKFYAAHKGRPYYEPYVKHMASGPIIVMELVGEDAVEDWRNLMGATDPEKAAMGTIRKAFGTAVNRNVVHGSDSEEAAEIERAFFWG
jgi:nucleoside-diphosphate kinase